MAAGRTYTPIATVNITSPTATVTFSNIPGTYTDLVLVGGGVLQINSGNGLRIRFNNDTATNYSDTEVKGNGGSATSQRETNQNSGYAGGQSHSDTNPGTSICHIMNYSNTTTYKPFIARGNQASTDVLLTANLWRSTAAITRIDLAIGSAFPTQNFASGTLTLYGIAAA